MSGFLSKQMRPLARELRAVGCDLVTGGNGHVRVTRDGLLLGMLSASPSNPSAHKKARSDFKRKGVLA